MLVVQLMVDITWCVKIANVRNKNPFGALITLIPVLEVIGWLYLAIDPKEKEATVTKPRREILTLDTV